MLLTMQSHIFVIDGNYTADHGDHNRTYFRLGPYLCHNPLCSICSLQVFATSFWPQGTIVIENDVCIVNINNIILDEKRC